MKERENGEMGGGDYSRKAIHRGTAITVFIRLTALGAY